MSLALAEYTSNGQYSSDGQLYFYFRVTFMDPEAIRGDSTDIQISVPRGFALEDLYAALEAGIQSAASDFEYTLEEGGITYPAFHKA